MDLETREYRKRWKPAVRLASSTRTLQVPKHTDTHELMGRETHYQAHITIFSLIVQKLENPNLSTVTYMYNFQVVEIISPWSCVVRNGNGMISPISHLQQTSLIFWRTGKS